MALRFFLLLLIRSEEERDVRQAMDIAEVDAVLREATGLYTVVQGVVKL
jgi:hypothetical protein